MTFGHFHILFDNETEDRMILKRRSLAYIITTMTCVIFLLSIIIYYRKAIALLFELLPTFSLVLLPVTFKLLQLLHTM